MQFPNVMSTVSSSHQSPAPSPKPSPTLVPRQTSCDSIDERSTKNESCGVISREGSIERSITEASFEQQANDRLVSAWDFLSLSVYISNALMGIPSNGGGHSRNISSFLCFSTPSQYLPSIICHLFLSSACAWEM